MQPQELPAERSSVLFGKATKGSSLGDGAKDKLRELYGKNPFEDTSKLEKPGEIIIGGPLERDYSAEERPLPSPNRRRYYSKEGKSLPDPLPKQDSGRRDFGSGPGRMC